MNEWERELFVDPEAVRAMAAPLRSFEPIASGWDSDAWLADGSIVWRVPRRKVGEAALEHEAWLLPRLAGRLPAPVPVPELVRANGLPAMTRHALVPGRELALTGEPVVALGASLGRFLRALHDPGLAAGYTGAMRVDPLGRGDPSRRIEVAHRRLSQVATWIDVAPLVAIVDVSGGPPLAPTALVHGDLHIRHVLVDDSGELSGVIDWGDSALGAPAIDLAVATALPPDSLAAFQSAYGTIDPAAWRHARLLGVMFGASLLAADPGGAVGAAALGWLERIARSPATPPPWRPSSSPPPDSSSGGR